jgi:hypothetical protein
MLVAIPFHLKDGLYDKGSQTPYAFDATHPLGPATKTNDVYVHTDAKDCYVCVCVCVCDIPWTAPFPPSLLMSLSIMQREMPTPSVSDCRFELEMDYVFARTWKEY